MSEINFFIVGNNNFSYYSTCESILVLRGKQPYLSTKCSLFSQSCFISHACCHSASPNFKCVLQFGCSRGSSVALFGGSLCPMLKLVDY